MIDSGMDEQVHRFFGRGTVEPYYPEAAKQVQQALLAAKSIIITHEHGDHVAGVIRTPFVDELAPKTLLTRAQVETLETNPQMPEIKITPAMASRYNVVDYDKYLPFGPGVALIKAPGHTPGSQMVYVALESGREYLFIGDTAWHMDGVRLIKGKDAPWIKEDDAALLAQLKWLNQLYRTEKNLVIRTQRSSPHRVSGGVRGWDGDDRFRHGRAGASLLRTRNRGTLLSRGGKTGRASASRSARAIIITHEHGDHVAGVIRTPFAAELAPKTILTRAPG